MVFRDRLAILPLYGFIGSRAVEYHWGLLRRIGEDRRVKGVMMLVESPGGTATSSEMLYEGLVWLSSKKPLYAYCLMAASGGYMASLAAKKIYVAHSGAVGSIGVLSLKPVLRDFFEKVGINLEVLKEGRMKDMGLFHRGYTEEERASIGLLNEAAFERFVGLVSQRRGLSLEKAREIATGELYPAQKALLLGLVDSVAGFDEALGRLSAETGVRKERAFFIRPRRMTLRRLLFGALFERTFSGI